MPPSTFRPKKAQRCESDGSLSPAMAHPPSVGPTASPLLLPAAVTSAASTSAAMPPSHFGFGCRGGAAKKIDATRALAPPPLSPKRGGGVVSGSSTTATTTAHRYATPHRQILHELKASSIDSPLLVSGFIARNSTASSSSACNNKNNSNNNNCAPAATTAGSSWGRSAISAFAPVVPPMAAPLPPTAASEIETNITSSTRGGGTPLSSLLFAAMPCENDATAVSHHTYEALHTHHASSSWGGEKASEEEEEVDTRQISLQQRHAQQILFTPASAWRRYTEAATSSSATATQQNEVVALGIHCPKAKQKKRAVRDDDDDDCEEGGAENEIESSVGGEGRMGAAAVPIQTQKLPAPSSCPPLGAYSPTSASDSLSFPMPSGPNWGWGAGATGALTATPAGASSCVTVRSSEGASVSIGLSIGLQSASSCGPAGAIAAPPAAAAAEATTATDGLSSSQSPAVPSAADRRFSNVSPLYLMLRQERHESRLAEQQQLLQQAQTAEGAAATFGSFCGAIVPTHRSVPRPAGPIRTFHQHQRHYEPLLNAPRKGRGGRDGETVMGDEVDSSCSPIAAEAAAVEGGGFSPPFSDEAPTNHFVCVCQCQQCALAGCGRGSEGGHLPHATVYDDDDGAMLPLRSSPSPLASITAPPQLSHGVASPTDTSAAGCCGTARRSAFVNGGNGDSASPLSAGDGPTSASQSVSHRWGGGGWGSPEDPSASLRGSPPHLFFSSRPLDSSGHHQHHLHHQAAAGHNSGLEAALLHSNSHSPPEQCHRISAELRLSPTSNTNASAPPFFPTTSNGSAFTATAAQTIAVSSRLTPQPQQRDITPTPYSEQQQQHNEMAHLVVGTANTNIASHLSRPQTATATDGGGGGSLLRIIATNRSAANSPLAPLTTTVGPPPPHAARDTSLSPIGGGGQSITTHSSIPRSHTSPAPSLAAHVSAVAPMTGSLAAQLRQVSAPPPFAASASGFFAPNPTSTPTPPPARHSNPGANGFFGFSVKNGGGPSATSLTPAPKAGNIRLPFSPPPPLGQALSLAASPFPQPGSVFASPVPAPVPINETQQPNDCGDASVGPHASSSSIRRLCFTDPNEGLTGAQQHQQQRNAFSSHHATNTYIAPSPWGGGLTADERSVSLAVAPPRPTLCPHPLPPAPLRFGAPPPLPPPPSAAAGPAAMDTPTCVRVAGNEDDDDEANSC